MKLVYTGWDERTYPQWLDLTDPGHPRTLIARPGGTYEVEPSSGLVDSYRAAMAAYEASGARTGVPVAPTMPTDAQWRTAEDPPDTPVVGLTLSTTTPSTPEGD